MAFFRKTSSKSNVELKQETHKTRSKTNVEFNPETKIPILRCSICTGEQVAGFKDKSTGHFTDVMLIKNQKDLDEFMRMYEIQEIQKEY